MPERTVAVASRSGLHARPAKIFVEAAARQAVPVRIRVGDGKVVPANSMLGVLTLGAGHGTEVTLEADGPGAEEALAALADLLSRDLDAEGAEGAPDAGAGAAGAA
ncbi:HPr family phosphocarrier protein [Microbispora catharanthi]|uniref:HPr family phosphocarrier protein n=1 Tax=Microbispora catharanthi TaxID=1712871 RepID=A0A5N6BG12_9ACTN|nr:HPr family phosphocarrier protein [Microbispora catharanthi]KAB8180011.1 HPr family phosphocarrier protein [Microbispora catharanthi]